MVSYLQGFVFIFLYRYVRLIVNCISHWTFRPVPIPDDPTLTSQDVTGLVATLGDDCEKLRETLVSMLRTEPFEIILVTIDANIEQVRQMVQSMGMASRIRILSKSQANKRRQMCCAIPEVKTKITILADDDVIWPQKIIPWMLAPFEKPDIGGVGTSQRLLRPEFPNMWHFLNALYLERRNFDISATTHIDGGLPCLSGRTAAYRTHILRDPEFLHHFKNELWLDGSQLNADDDNFITRWMLSHHWGIYIQYIKEAEVITSLEGNPNFLKQCLRWARSNWRSNLTSMFRERHVWRRQPWSAYAIQLATLSPPALVVDLIIVYFGYKATNDLDSQRRTWALALLGCWMFATKFLKLMGHFIRYPCDISLLPISILFGYAHGFIKIYALFTLNVTTWGSREGADTDDDERMMLISQTEKC